MLIDGTKDLSSERVLRLRLLCCAVYMYLCVCVCVCVCVCICFHVIIIHIDGNSTVIRQCYENSSSRRETSRIYQEEERTAGIDLAVKISKISFSFSFSFSFEQARFTSEENI